MHPVALIQYIPLSLFLSLSLSLSPSCARSVCSGPSFTLLVVGCCVMRFTTTTTTTSLSLSLSLRCPILSFLSIPPPIVHVLSQQEKTESLFVAAAADAAAAVKLPVINFAI